MDKDTKLCISIALKPGITGTALHNAGYKALNLNYIYKAFSVRDLEGALQGVKALGIKGCSVSMPFKEEVLNYLDSVDEAARRIGSVNTIVNRDGELKGYNTDITGAKAMLKHLKVNSDASVLLLGAGGVSRAMLCALEQEGFSNLAVTNRDKTRLEKLNNTFIFNSISWNERNDYKADLLINATSVGMYPDEKSLPIRYQSERNFSAVADVVVSTQETRLINLFKEEKKLYAPGFIMSLDQALEQFKLYTGKDGPREVFEKRLKALIKRN